MSVGTTYDLDFGPALAALDKLADQDEKFRSSVLQTARAQQQATQQVAQAAVAATAAVQQQAQQQVVIRDAYKALTGELRAQQREEKALNAERDKASGSAKRQQELAAALVANRAQQQRLREEIERTTAAQQAQARAAQTAAGVPTADNGGLRQANQLIQGQTGAYTQAAQAAAELQQRLQSATREQQAARAVVTEQIAALRQLRVEQKALKAEQAAGGSTQEQVRIKQALQDNEQAQRELNSVIAESRIAYQQEGEAVTQVRTQIQQQAQAQKLATAATRDAAAAEKTAATAAKDAAELAKQKARQAKLAAQDQDKQAKSAGLLTRLEKQLLDLTEARAKATTRVQVLGYNKQINDTKRELASLKGEAEGTGAAGTSMLGKFAAGAVVAGGVTLLIDQLAKLSTQIVDTTVNSERLNAVLTTAFKGDGDKARIAQLNLQSFAIQNGIKDVEALEASYATLVNRGIEPTNDQLRQLADISATTGKQAGQFIEALLDAQSGSYERLQEFGVKQKDLGDKLAFTFRGVTTEVEKTDTAIANYLFSLGDLNGVQGTAAAVAARTGGAVASLSARFTELFDVLGERGKGAFNAFLADLNKVTGAVTDFFKSNERKAQESVAKTSSNYSGVYAGMFKRAAAEAKQQSKDVNEALGSVLDEQLNDLNTRLEIARKREQDLAKFSATGSLTNQRFRRNFEGGTEGFRQAELEATTMRIGLETNIRLVREQYEAAKKGSAKEAETLGLILKLRQEIAGLEKKRELPKTTENEILSKGGLNDQIEAKQKELDRLLGKEEAKKKEVDKLTSALNALREAERRLLDEAGKARLEQLREDGIALANEQLKQDLLAIQRLEDTIKKKEALVKKAGGTGADADGLLNPDQQEQINLLTTDAQRRRDETVLALERQTNARILELQVESDEKEVAQLEAKFDEEIRVARLGHNERLAVELEAAKNRELVALKEAQDLRRIEEATAREVEAISRQKTLTPQVGGPDVTSDGSNNPALSGARKENIFRRLLAKAAVDIEKDKQKRILEAQIRGYNEQLKRLEDNFTDEGIKRKTALQNSVEDTTASLNKLNNQPKEFNLLKALGVAPEDEEDVREALQNVSGAVVNALSEIFAAEQAAAANKAANATTAISELNSQLTQEIALRKEGSASNIATLREQIQEQKKVRAEAVKEQRKAAQQQVILDTLTQGSSVATAAAQALAALTPLGPFGFLLGIAAATTIVGAFTAAKVKAFQAAGKSGNDGGGGFFLGGYTGDGDVHAESTRLGKKSYVYHNKEFVVNNELTSQYRYALLEPLHKGRPDLVDWTAPQMKALLPDLELPKQIRAEKQAAAHVQVVQQFAPMQAEFKAMQQELAEIKQAVSTTAARPDVFGMTDGSVMQVDPKTGSTVRRYTEGAKSGE